MNSKTKQIISKIILVLICIFIETLLDEFNHHWFARFACMYQGYLLYKISSLFQKQTS